jgi:hypothetical protein
MATVRAKFQCHSVEQFSSGPREAQRYMGQGVEPQKYMTWPRVYRFTAQYDTTLPEDQRYAQATPSGTLQISVDNPLVTFEPGKAYYLDFTPADPDQPAS